MAHSQQFYHHHWVSILCVDTFFLSLVKNAAAVCCLVSRFLDPYFLFPITIDYIVYSAPVSLLVFFWKHSNFGLNV